MLESEYGMYLKADVDRLFSEGQKHGNRVEFLRGLIIGTAIGCAVTAFICYRQFGPPSQVPNLSLLIGDLQRAKDDCEGIVYSLKNRWRAKVISDADSRAGASDYRDLASRFNGISATLEAMLSTGHDDNSVKEMQANLVDAQRRYLAFRAWFEMLPREIPRVSPKPHVPPDGHIIIGDATGDTKFEGLPEVAIDLAKHFFDGMKEMDKLKRENLIGMLHGVRFKTWHDIPEDAQKR